MKRPLRQFADHIHWMDVIGVMKLQLLATACAQSTGFLGCRSSNDLRPLRVLAQNPRAEAESMRAMVGSFYQAINAITMTSRLGATNFRIWEDPG